MLLFYIFKDPVYWVLPLLIQIVSYFGILKKMGKKPYLGIIPVIGEWALSKDLFKRMRSFWRPVVVVAALYTTVMIIGSGNEYSAIMRFVAFLSYGIFLARLYMRLGKQFGKGRVFRVLLFLLPIVFLPILAFGKSRYMGPPEFKPDKPRGKASRVFRKVGLVFVSLVEIAVLSGGCFLITMIVRPVRPMTEYLMRDTMSRLSSVTDTDEIVGRDTTLGAGYEEIVEAQRTRGYFFPDHSRDEKVVVMEYVIGSNLEDARGFASINIAQMKDATAKGECLDFVIQAGGSDRWFTAGIKDSTVGRYLISGGKLETADMLDAGTCMSDPETLREFIVWAKRNYAADRYMLVLWDHGGGFASGYGVDDLNKRSDGEEVMSASEIIGAIKDAGVKFDVIGFDACLMQNVEYACALEPFADYYLASEETEPGTGWFYTAGFGKLAADPTLSTEEFAKAMISSYDQSNRATNKGEPNREGTLSLVDLTLVKPVYEKLTGLYDKAAVEVTDNRVVFANMSAGRSYAYQFADEEQVDLISFLTSLKNADYREQVMTDAELDEIAEMVKACVVWRNSDAAEGINGLAIDFPYKSLRTYSYEHQQLKAVNYTSEQNFFDRFCSIMASQRMSANNTDSFWGILTAEDYTNEDWYIKGFEDYDTADLFIDIPVIETEDGYLPDLPDKTWDTILDCKVAAYMVTDDGLMYIGREHFSEQDEEGHPLVNMYGYWARVNGHLVCYETEEPLITEEGIVYRGRVRARLNGEEDIVLHIEWNPAAIETEADSAGNSAGGSAGGGGEPTGSGSELTGAEGELTGNVTGYSLADEEDTFFMRKGLEQFRSGDVIEFLFDFYDESGNLIKTEVYGDKLRVITDDRLTVKDELFESGTRIQYFGVLTDVYQRDLITEEIMGEVE